MVEIAEEVLEEVDNYVARHQNTVAQFIMTIYIVDICLVAERCPGAWVIQRWWEKDNLDPGGDVGGSKGGVYGRDGG